MLTIGIDVRTVSHHRAGIGIYVENLVKALSEVRTNERFILLGDTSTRWDLLPNSEEFTPYTIRSGSWSWHFHAARLSGKMDLYHSPSSLFVPYYAGKKAILTVHDLVPLQMGELSNFKTWLTYRLLHKTIERVGTIITVSEFTKQDLRRHFPNLQTEITAIPLAPRPAHNPDEAFSRPPRPYFLSVGTLEPRKNLPFLVRAYIEAAQRQIDLPNLVIVGKVGWKNAELSQLLKSPSLQQRIHLTGYVTDNQLEHLYRGATAFVYPSLFEGFGLPVVEALARDIPVITSTTSSLPEVGGSAALYVDPTNQESLISGLLAICDPSLRADLIRKGRCHIKQFSWQETARRTLDVYRLNAPQNRMRSQ